MIRKQKSLQSSAKIRKISPAKPASAFIQEAAQLIRSGGVVAFPTTCLYGLGADAFRPDAVDRIFRIKHRAYDKPLLALIKSKEDLRGLVRHVPRAASRLMDRFWPGRITIVLEAKDTLPSNLTAGIGKIGVRLPGHPVALALVNEVQGPITGTSANLSGHPGISRVSEMDASILDQLDMVLDAGPLKGGIGSTIIDATVDIPKILREGEVAERDIRAALEGP